MQLPRKVHNHETQLEVTKEEEERKMIKHNDTVARTDIQTKKDCNKEPPCNGQQKYLGGSGRGVNSLHAG